MGILNHSSIGIAVRLNLRSPTYPDPINVDQETLVFFGEEVSHLLYRYLYLHLRFQKLQQRSSFTFDAVGMLPTMYFYIHSFGKQFMPSIIHAGLLD